MKKTIDNAKGLIKNPINSILGGVAILAIGWAGSQLISIPEMRGDITEIRSDVTEIRKDMAEMKQAQSRNMEEIRQTQSRDMEEIRQMQADFIAIIGRIELKANTAIVSNKSLRADVNTLEALHPRTAK